jgi:hypothetical protein
MNYKFLLAALSSLVISSTAFAQDEDPENPLRPPSVFVHMDGDHMFLEKKNVDEHTWVVQCHTPCDRAEPLNAVYRFSGFGKSYSQEFELDGNDGDRVSIYVNAGDADSARTGEVLTYISLPIFVSGMAAIVIGAVQGSDPHNTENVKNGQSLQLDGVLIAGTSLLALVPGLILLINNENSTMTQTLTKDKYAVNKSCGAFCWKF